MLIFNIESCSLSLINWLVTIESVVLCVGVDQLIAKFGSFLCVVHRLDAASAQMSTFFDYRSSSSESDSSTDEVDNKARLMRRG